MHLLHFPSYHIFLSIIYNLMNYKLDAQHHTLLVFVHRQYQNIQLNCFAAVWLGVQKGRQWHGLFLEVYSVFPFWHARNSRKRNSKDTLQ